MNVVDSSAWIEYIRDGSNARYFADAIEDVTHLIVPTIALFEVYKRVLVECGVEDANQSIAQMKLGRVQDLDEEIALTAARLSAAHRLPLADSVIYATAKLARATLWTQDEHFAALPNVKYKSVTKNSRR